MADGAGHIGASDGFDSADPQSSLLLPGVGYRLVEVKDANGNLVITHKNTIEKAVEIDPEAAEWTRRGAELIAYEGKSAIDITRLFNEHKVGGKQTWSDGRVRQHYGREKLVGKDVLHKTRQVIDRQTGKKKVVQLPESEWIWRDVPHLRILSDQLAQAVHSKLSLGAESFGRKAKDRRKKVYRAELYPKVLIRPICGCCGNPTILGRSVGKYQSFFCFNASNGIKGCTNRGYKSARIIDEAVLGVVMATLFTDGFIADLTAEVNKRLAWITRQPKRLTDRDDKLYEGGISLEQVRRVHPLLSQLGGELFSKQNVVQLVQERHARNDLRLAGRSRVDQSPWHPAPDEPGYGGVRVKHQPHGAAPHDTPGSRPRSLRPSWEAFRLQTASAASLASSRCGLPRAVRAGSPRSSRSRASLRPQPPWRGRRKS